MRRAACDVEGGIRHIRHRRLPAQPVMPGHPARLDAQAVELRGQPRTRAAAGTRVGRHRPVELPVPTAVRIRLEQNIRSHQGDARDLDPAGQQRQQVHPRLQPRHGGHLRPRPTGHVGEGDILRLQHRRKPPLEAQRPGQGQVPPRRPAHRVHDPVPLARRVERQRGGHPPRPRPRSAPPRRRLASVLPCEPLASSPPI